MGASRGVEQAVKTRQFRVDPGFVTRRTRLNDTLEILIYNRVVSAELHLSHERSREMKTIQREDAAAFRVDPEKFGIVAVLGHREDAAGIAVQQQFRRQAHGTRSRPARPASGRAQLGLEQRSSQWML